jgi:hypothetical protein
MAISSKPGQRLSRKKLREIRRRQAARSNRQRQAQRARLNRQSLQHNFSLLPSPIRSFFSFFSPSFSKPTFFRFAILTIATILTVGSRTVSNLLRTLGCLAPGDPSAYHRVFSCASWSSWRVSRTLLGWILTFRVGDGPVCLAADDTVDEHPGDKVYGKGCHRDAVRSTHSFTAFRWGHKWLVLAVLVSLPGACRPWPLPFFVVLCTSKKYDEDRNRRHRTPAQILKLLLVILRRWYPDRTFVCAADGNFACHDLAGSVSRGNSDKAAQADHPQRGQIHFVSRFYPNAALYEAAPPEERKANGKRKSSGRPAEKGKQMETPEEVVNKTVEKKRLTVAWYGGGERNVEVVSGKGNWYRAGQGQVAVQWVHVHDLDGTHRDEYFFSTDQTMTEQVLIEHYVRRWNLETTFQEMRSYVGLETTRGWKQETVERMAPMLFCTYSVVACLYSTMPAEHREKGRVEWEGKETLTFSDALTAVRMWLWEEWIFPCHGQSEVFKSLPVEFQQVLLRGLAPAA